MPEKSILEDMAEEIGKLLAEIGKYRHIPLPGEIPEDLLIKLGKVEKDVELFCKIQDQFLEKKNVDIKNLKKVNEVYGDRSKRLLEFIAKLKLDAESQLRALQFTLNYINQNKKSGQNQAESAKRRRKKFKPLGGDNKWIPM